MITLHENRQLVLLLICFRNTYKLKTRFNVKLVNTKQININVIIRVILINLQMI